MSFIVLSLLASFDPCSFAGPDDNGQLHLEPGSRFTYTQSYPRTWVECANAAHLPAPRLLVKAKEGRTVRLIVDETMPLKGALDPKSSGQLRKRFDVCQKPTNSRPKDAVLYGAEGKKRWHAPVQVSVDVLAEGPLEALAQSLQTIVMCPVCREDQPAKSSFYRLTGGKEKNIARMYVHIPAERYACAKGGGALHLRYFWGEPGEDVFTPTTPFKTVHNLESKLSRDGDTMIYEERMPTASLCKAGKRLVWELVGTGEYAFIANRRGLGPSRHIRRGTVEFLSCP